MRPAPSGGFPLAGLVLPSQANWLSLRTGAESRDLLTWAVTHWRERRRLPAVPFLEPFWNPSYQRGWRFDVWQAGYPCLVLSDPARGRAPWLGTEQDTPDRLTYDRFGQVVMEIAAFIDALAEPAPGAPPAVAPASPA